MLCPPTHTHTPSQYLEHNPSPEYHFIGSSENDVWGQIFFFLLSLCYKLPDLALQGIYGHTEWIRTSWLDISISRKCAHAMLTTFTYA